MYSIPRTLSLEGQEFIFNDIPTPTIVSLQLTQPFLSTGEKIGWNDSFGKVVSGKIAIQWEQF